MKSINAIALVAFAAAMSACNDKVPKPEMESRPPSTGGMTAPTPSAVEPAPGGQPPTQPDNPTQAPFGPNK